MMKLLRFPEFILYMVADLLIVNGYCAGIFRSHREYMYKLMIKLYKSGYTITL